MLYLRSVALALALVAAPAHAAGDDGHELAHSHAGELCGCAQHEADHPFTIDCKNGPAIRKAYADLQTCEVDGKPTKDACGKVTDGVMKCQQAFFVIQAHHDYCSHDTLTREEEEYFHVWESSCMKCKIERQFNASLADCGNVNCKDITPLDTAFWTLNTTCLAADNTVEYEWGGSFVTAANSYTWVSQPTGTTPGSYTFVDPTMTMTFMPATSAASVPYAGPVMKADMLLQGTCHPVQHGDTIVPSMAHCFLLNFSTGQADFTATIDTTGVSHLAIFAQHVPTEFERPSNLGGQHFFQTAAGVDVEAVKTVGAPAGHDHGRRRLGALGNCCYNKHQIGAFKQIVAYHDLCGPNDLPFYIENGLHDYEASCEDYFCNAVSAGYDGTICPSPPSPPTPPPPMTIIDEIPGGAIAGIAVAGGVAVVLLIALCVMYGKEKSGKPLFTDLNDVRQGKA